MFADTHRGVYFSLLLSVASFGGRNMDPILDGWREFFFVLTPNILFYRRAFLFNPAWVMTRAVNHCSTHKTVLSLKRAEHTHFSSCSIRCLCAYAWENTCPSRGITHVKTLYAYASIIVNCASWYEPRLPFRIPVYAITGSRPRKHPAFSLRSHVYFSIDLLRRSNHLQYQRFSHLKRNLKIKNQFIIRNTILPRSVLVLKQVAKPFG